MKIVLNKCFGGFSISKKCAETMASMGCERAKAELLETEEAKDGRWYGYGYVKTMNDGYDRTSKYLIDAVEQLGDEANNFASELKVVEIPDGIDYEIDEYDGIESVHEKHRSW